MRTMLAHFFCYPKTLVVFVHILWWLFNEILHIISFDGDEILTMRIILVQRKPTRCKLKLYSNVLRFFHQSERFDVLYLIVRECA